jgi:nitric oxide reductase large subunit
MQMPAMNTLRWMRVFGDTLFAFGAGAFVLAVLRLTWRRDAREADRAQHELAA